jgi:malonyl-CoA O-methyltransferase
MVEDIDRKKVRQSFDRQASDYDDYAVVQRTVVDNLLGTVQSEGLRPGRLLDIGCGTGRLLAKLRELYPDSAAIGADLAFGMCATAADRGGVVVNADAENLPFADSAFDLVLSTSTYQWLTSLHTAFAEVRRVLAPGGMFCFALFGERTLFELRDSYREALGGGAGRSHSFFSQAYVLDALQCAGFTQARVRSELEVEYHTDVPELLRSLKKIGAGSASPVSAKGLSERRVMLDMMAVYRERYQREAGIPATYEVIYGVGRKG